jgi:hypothetical protein
MSFRALINRGIGDGRENERTRGEALDKDWVNG